MFTVKDFKKKLNQFDEVDLPPECLVHEEEYIDGKLLFNIVVWKHGEQFFEMTYTRDNSGYWGEGENYPPEVTEVFPIEVTTTKYVERTKNVL